MRPSLCPGEFHPEITKSGLGSSHPDLRIPTPRIGRKISDACDGDPASDELAHDVGGDGGAPGDRPTFAVSRVRKKTARSRAYSSAFLSPDSAQRLVLPLGETPRNEWTPQKVRPQRILKEKLLVEESAALPLRTRWQANVWALQRLPGAERPRRHGVDAAANFVARAIQARALSRGMAIL